MRVVSFFAGCGGLDLGFEQAGFQVVWANELDQSVRDTYIRNHPNTKLVLCDINNVRPEEIPDCDGFIGGPPCQSWSVAGKQRGLNDERGRLFLTYIDFIKEKKPKFFLIENVKGMLDAKFSDVFQDFVNRLFSAGYDVKWKLLDAVNYSIPQNRERLFLIGFRKELNINFEFPLPTCTEPVTLRRALGDITEEPVRYSGKEKVVVNTQRSDHDVLATEFGPFYYRGNRRRGWQQPSFTIHATADNIQLHPSSPKMMFYGHENWNFQKDKMSQYRRLSVRECARIQTFPDSFIFENEDIKTNYKMIGNAVPPRLGMILAQSILSAFVNHNIIETATLQKTNTKSTDVLVGYFKDMKHYNAILQNLIYYVRSDGRKGSIFKEDCEMTPKYLLLHHKEYVKFFELDSDEPVLASASFLNTCGFSCSGETYLCFKLRNKQEQSIKDFGGDLQTLVYDKYNYAPYITTLDKILNKNE